ncbi:MAG TPA: hypothetical protein VLH87_02280 [Pyrinomonadaceae bacterium]|nr:hypothetical protein [Pyrinomonadaceae bacterium]
MQLFDPKNPNEKKKIIAAAGLGVVAIAVLGYVFFGSSGGANRPQPNNNNIVRPGSQSVDITKQKPADSVISDDLNSLTPIPVTWSAPAVGEANRNIFAYYEPTPTPVPERLIPTPTPMPPPPLTVTSLAPSNVYARTADFSLEVMGDKFVPGVRIAIDGRDLQTRFISAQQIGATVPAALISTPGVRQVMARSFDGKLYSNVVPLNVTAPPVPNYNYVGIIGKPRGNDVAVLIDKSSKEMLNVMRGDVMAGRFRVTSISERELVLTDTTLKIKHTLPFSTEGTTGTPLGRPTPRVAVDDEP